MQIPKQMIVDYVEQQFGGDQAAQAAQQLPDQVDHEQDSQLLQSVGVDPQQLLGHVSSQDDGQLASEAKGLLGNL